LRALQTPGQLSERSSEQTPENETGLAALAELLLQGNGPAALRAKIRSGGDPLGTAFARLRPAHDRRALGATYTPPAIVAAMLDWAVREASGAPIRRVVDPGAGSGRFLLAAARRFPETALMGVEIDPLAAALLRANLAAAGLADRATVIEGDYRGADLPAIDGRTLFIGNPPYLRHHGIALQWKDWYAAASLRHGVKASRLAGLHLHFFLRTLDLARPGDLGCFVTAAEWLDVNYGAALRELLLGPLGLTALHRLDPKALPFEDAVTTGAIIGFRAGSNAAVTVSDVAAPDRLGDLSDGVIVPRAAFAAPRWTQIGRAQRSHPAGWIALGEICRVHRGQVTGGNPIWIAGPHSPDLPERFLFPAVTKARELIVAGDTLSDASALRRVIDLPANLDPHEPAVQRFLAWAKAEGADASYIARHRPAWWSVGLRPPAPILCTYMARRPPAFVRNCCGARHINIAHGLYPRAPIADATLDALAAWLGANVAQSSGRTYAGGLTKFEPREMERVAVPPLEELAATVASRAG
jgi:SAM-dependent methyltransferase